VADEDRREIALAADADELELVKLDRSRGRYWTTKSLSDPRPSWLGGSPPANGLSWSRRHTWRCASVTENAWGREPPGSLPRTLGG
jgi:hypothetical protein